MKRIIIGIIFIATALSGTNLYGYNVYLDQVNGNNSNDGKTASTAVKGLASALALIDQQGSSDNCIVMCRAYQLGSSYTIDGRTKGITYTFIRNDGYSGPIFDIWGSYEGYLATEHTSCCQLALYNTVLSGKTVSGQSPSNGEALISTDHIGDYSFLLENASSNRYRPVYKIILGEGSVLRDNTISGYGAGVLLRYAELEMQAGCLIENCNASYGGGICSMVSRDITYPCPEYDYPGVTPFKPHSKIVINGGVIYNCTSWYLGGAIYASACVETACTEIDVTALEVKYCKAEHDEGEISVGRGGAIASGRFTNLRLDGTYDNASGYSIKLHDNFALYYGGALQIDSGAQCYLNCAEINSNEAYDGAGGIHVTGIGSHLEILGGSVHHNKTNGVGGGLHTSEKGVLAITGDTNFHDNEAKMQGGAININTGTSLEIDGQAVKFYGNKAGSGGAIMVDGASVTLKSGEIFENQALNYAESPEKNRGKGGAVCLAMDNSKSVYQELVPSFFFMQGGKLYDNSSYSSGGAIAMIEKSPEYECEDQPKVEIFSGEIYGNTAANGDGGAFCVYTGDMIIHAGSFEDNHADLSNGGVFYVNGGNAYIYGGSLTSNTAINGGAAYVDGGSLSIIDEVGNTATKTITGNTATQDGGGFFVNGGDVTLANASIDGNHAVTGAGLYSNGGAVTFTSGTLNDNIASGNGGGAFISGGSVIFNGNISGNTALNGGGLYLDSGASMTFTGGIISKNKAIHSSSSVSNTAYYGRTNTTLPVEGCGGGLFLANGPDSGHCTTLNFVFPEGYNTFGLYTNSASKAGDDIVSEGGNSYIKLPSVANMSLIGFEGQDANPIWYQDYYSDDDEYDNPETGPQDHHAVAGDVTRVERYKTILNNYSDEITEHMILDDRLEQITNNYLCLTLGFSMLDLTISAKGLLGGETALIQLIRYGSSANKVYDIILKKKNSNDEKASKVLKSMPWGTYSLTLDPGWNWAYEPVERMTNIRLGNTGQYEIVIDMHHKSVSMQPLHYDVHNTDKDDEE